MGIGTPLPPLGRSTRTGILALGLGITLALNGLIAFGLWQDRRVHIDQATSRLEGLAQVCETYTNRLLDSFDTLLLVLRDRLQAGANLDELHWLMKAQKARTPHLLVLLALDAQGRVRAVSEDGPVPDLSDRPYFTAHRGRNDAGLLIDLPRQSRYHDGQWFFALSRRLNDEQGRFAGVVVAAIDWAAVAGDYARLLEGGWDQVSLFHADGGAMLHVPMATDWSEGPILPAEAPPATAGSGAISIRAFPDGKERVTLDRNLSDFPLTLSVAEPLDAALEEWRGHVTIGVGVGGAMTLATFGLVLLLFRQTAAREDALRLLTQSEARTRAVFNQTFQLIALLDTEGRLLQANDQALAFAGIDETAVVGRFLWDTPWWIAAEEDSHGQLRHAVTGAAKGRFVRFEATHRSLDGRPVLFDVSVKPVRDETNGVVMILAEGRDITELRQAEELLRAGEERFRSMAANVPGLIFQWYRDPDGRQGFHYVSPRSSEILGFANEASLADWSAIPIPPEDRERWDQSLQPAITGQGDWEYDGRVILPDGEVRWINGIARPLVKPGGEILLNGVIIDVTARHLMEERLRQAQALQTALLDNGFVGIAHLRDRQLVWVNQRLTDMFGYRIADLKGQTTEVFFPESGQYEAFGVACYPTLNEGHVYLEERPMRRKDGTLFWCRLSGRLLVPDDPAQGSVWVLDDVDVRRRAEDELRIAKERAEAALQSLEAAQESLVRSEKMAALGGLVAGVAHEINTPVGVTLTSASHLAKEVAGLRRLYEGQQLAAEDLEEFLETAGEATRLMVSTCERAAALIQSFKRVAVDQTAGERRVFNLGEYIDEILLSLRPHLRKTQHRVIVDCPGALELDGDPGALSQGLTNLIMNALIHAFDDGRAGTIRIDVTCPDAETVELRFADDGKGIAGDIQDRIFDPFFTTKRSAGGSGLGLHILHNVVTGPLRGTLALDSTVSQGTTFILRFPRILPPSEPAAVPPSLPALT